MIQYDMIHQLKLEKECYIKKGMFLLKHFVFTGDVIYMRVVKSLIAFI